MHFAGLVLTIQWLWERLVAFFHQLSTDVGPEAKREKINLLGVEHVCQKFAQTLGPEEICDDEYGNKGLLYKLRNTDLAIVPILGAYVLHQLEKRGNAIYIIYQENNFGMPAVELSQLLIYTAKGHLKTIAVVIISGADPETKDHPLEHRCNPAMNEEFVPSTEELQRKYGTPADLEFKIFHVEPQSKDQYRQVLDWVRTKMYRD